MQHGGFRRMLRWRQSLARLLKGAQSLPISENLCSSVVGLWEVRFRGRESPRRDWQSTQGTYANQTHRIRLQKVEGGSTPAVSCVDRFVALGAAMAQESPFPRDACATGRRIEKLEKIAAEFSLTKARRILCCSFRKVRSRSGGMFFFSGSLASRSFGNPQRLACT